MELALGKIIREHGIKGWCLFFLFNPSSTLFKKGLKGTLKNEGNYREDVLLEECQNKAGKYYVKFDFINTPEDLEKWRQSVFYIETKSFEVLAEGEFYFDSLLGYSVHNKRDGFLGELVGFSENKGIQWLVIKDERGVEQLIPWTQDVFEAINPEDKKIHVVIPEGLVDLWKLTS